MKTIYFLNFEKYLYANTHRICTGNFNSWEICDLFYTTCQQMALMRPVFKYVTFWAAHPNLGTFPLYWFHLQRLSRLIEFSLNTRCNGTRLSEWDLCLQWGYLLPNHLVCSHFLIRKTAYGVGKKKKRKHEGGDRNLCLDFHSSIIRKHEALFLTVHI